MSYYREFAVGPTITCVQMRTHRGYTYSGLEGDLVTRASRWRKGDKCVLLLPSSCNGQGTNFAPSLMMSLMRRQSDPQLRFDRGTVR